MREGRPSHTAYHVAMRRAAHQKFDKPPVFTDPLALRVLAPDDAASLQPGGRFDAGLRAFLAVRSRVAEDELARAVECGVAQYVVLGAGLDTFGYRNPYPTDRLRVFEVDHPATQAFKQRRLSDAGLAVPPSLRFVPIDFTRDDLLHTLSAAGLALKRPAFFAWLGVTLYLPVEAVMSTLRMVLSAAHGGGGIVFDYGVTARRLSLLQRLLLASMAARVRSVGEPWITYFDPAVLSGELRELGFSEVEDLGPEELNARYFAGRTDRLRVGGLSHVMVARAC